MRKIVKIFWIDDMTAWAVAVQKNLEILAPKYGVQFVFISAKNGEDEDVVQKCSLYDFDLILMDYHMEPYNGDKYIHDIRNEEHLTTIPIIFYSQDNTTDLLELVRGLPNVIAIYRPNLEDKIREKFFINQTTE